MIGQRMVRGKERVVGKIDAKPGGKSEAGYFGMLHGNQVHLIQRQRLSKIHLNPFALDVG